MDEPPGSSTRARSAGRSGNGPARLERASDTPAVSTASSCAWPHLRPRPARPKSPLDRTRGSLDSSGWPPGPHWPGTPRVRAAVARARESLIDREVLTDVVALCTVAREHLLVVGPPGTAKSEAVRRVAAQLGGVTSSTCWVASPSPTRSLGRSICGACRTGSSRSRPRGCCRRRTSPSSTRSSSAPPRSSTRCWASSTSGSTGAAARCSTAHCGSAWARRTGSRTTRRWMPSQTGSSPASSSRRSGTFPRSS